MADRAGVQERQGCMKRNEPDRGLRRRLGRSWQPPVIAGEGRKGGRLEERNGDRRLDAAMATNPNRFIFAGLQTTSPMVLATKSRPPYSRSGWVVA